MSLYNMVMGMNPHSNELKKILGLSFLEDKMYRFRDIWLSEDGNKINLLTRLGSIKKSDKNISILRGNPFYIEDFPSPCESYQVFVFSTPIRMVERAKEMVETGGYMNDPLRIFSKALSDVKEGNASSEYAQNAKAVLELIAPALNKVVDSDSQEERIIYGDGCVVVRKFASDSVSILDEDAY